jgi:sigma-B regulation protein RsbU (phosphoserine phosphatase)
VLATLEKKALRDRTRDELRRKQAELGEARTLQLALAPPPFADAISGHPVSIEAMLEPAKEVGGDLVDYFALDERLLVMLVGDVSDKGAGAALMMARTHAMFRALAARPDAAELFTHPEQAAAIVNNELAQGNGNCMFVTLLLATLDMATGVLSYIRAGHVPPYLVGTNGTVRRLDKLSGPPLGVVDHIAYRPETVQLEAGMRLLTVTDGFTEAQDPAGELYGEERVGDFLVTIEAGTDDTLTQLARIVRAFEQGQPAFDDMAALLLTLKPPS